MKCKSQHVVSTQNDLVWENLECESTWIITNIHPIKVQEISFLSKLTWTFSL